MKRILFYYTLIFVAFSANASNFDPYENEVRPKLLELKNTLSPENRNLKNSQNTAIQKKEEILKCLDENLDSNVYIDLISNLEKITPNIFQEGTALRLVRGTIAKNIENFMLKKDNESKFRDKITNNEKNNRMKDKKQFEDRKSYDYIN